MQDNNFFFLNETNIYAFTVPGMYGKKNLVEVRKQMLPGLFETYIRLLLSIYLCI